MTDLYTQSLIACASVRWVRSLAPVLLDAICTEKSARAQGGPPRNSPFILQVIVLELSISLLTSTCLASSMHAANLLHRRVLVSGRCEKEGGSAVNHCIGTAWRTPPIYTNILVAEGRSEFYNSRTSTRTKSGVRRPYNQRGPKRTTGGVEGHESEVSGPCGLRPLALHHLRVCGHHSCCAAQTNVLHRPKANFLDSTCIFVCRSHYFGPPRLSITIVSGPTSSVREISPPSRYSQNDQVVAPECQIRRTVPLGLASLGSAGADVLFSALPESML